MPLDDAMYVPVVVVIPDKKFHLVRVGYGKVIVHVSEAYVPPFFNSNHCLFIPAPAFIKDKKILVLISPLPDELNYAPVIFLGRLFANACAIALVHMVPEAGILDLIKST